MDANAALQYGDPASAALNGVGAPAQLTKAYAAAKQKQTADINAEQQEMQPAVQKYEQTASTPMQAPPKAPKAGGAPDAQQFNQESQKYVGLIAALSALVGARGRGRGTAALGAYGAGLKALKESNQQAFDNAVTKWKADTEAHFKESDAEFKEYQANIENRKLSESEMVMNNKMIAEKNQNKVLAAADSVDHIGGMVDSYIKTRWQVGMAADKQKQMAEAQQEKYQKTKDDYKNDTASQTELNTYMNGGKPLLAGYGVMRQAKQDALDEMAHDKDPNFDYTTAQAKLQAFKQGAGQLSKQVETVTFASNELDKSLPSLMAITQKYQLGNFKTANEAYRFMQDKYPSSEDFKNFDTQMRAVKSAYALFIGRGASRGTVHSDEEAGKIADTDMGTLSMSGFINGVNTERKNALDGANTTIKDWYATKGGTASPIPGGSTPPAGAPAGGAAPDFSHLWSGGD